MIRECREALLDAGLVFAEVSAEPSPVDGVTLVESVYVLSVADAPDDESVLLRSTQAASGSGGQIDKAISGARTFNVGYTLRGLLNLPRGEDPDARDDRSDRDKARDLAVRWAYVCESVKSGGVNFDTACEIVQAFSENGEAPTQDQERRGRSFLARVAKQHKIALNKNTPAEDFRRLRDLCERWLNEQPGVRVEADDRKDGE